MGWQDMDGVALNSVIMHENAFTEQMRFFAVMLVVLAIALGWRLVAVSPSLHFALSGSPPHPVSLHEGASPVHGGATPDAAEDTGVFVVDDGRVWVHIRGEVRNPGVYRVPEGTRLAELIGYAGGLTADAVTDDVNLAVEISDGDEVVISAGNTGQGHGADVVNINTASSERLQELPGIGPVLAQRIIEYRERRGDFSSVEQLLDVSGIGDVTLKGLRDRATVR